MHPLEQHIQSTIDRRGLLRRSSPVLVALSGGADSVALLAVLHRLGYECTAAHCNFKLRGEESTRDMRHAEAIARNLGVNIYIKDFNVAARMKATGESVEMACRSLRYDWFHSLLDRDYSQAIAVGHHREDNVETFLINLLRSSGITGLAGMDYRRGYVVRPMLDVSRAQIEEYLTDTGLEFVTDSSNLGNDYTRNKFRNVILPVLEGTFPGAGEAILRSVGHLRQALEVFNYAVDAESRKFGDPADGWDIDAFTERMPPNIAPTLLFELLKPYGFNATQTADILESAIAGRSGRTFRSASHTAELSRGILTVNDSRNAIVTSADTYTVSLKRDILTPVHIQVTPHHVTEFRPERGNAAVAYLDSRVLEGNPTFEIRRPRNGDKMAPYGMEGEKLLSDLFRDAHFSAAQKRNAWVLTRNGRILWVLGLRASRHYSVSPATQNYLRLEVSH